MSTYVQGPSHIPTARVERSDLTLSVRPPVLSVTAVQVGIAGGRVKLGLIFSFNGGGWNAWRAGV